MPNLRGEKLHFLAFGHVCVVLVGRVVKGLHELFQLSLTIRKNFENLTVLTIAHRIQTIIDSDLVLVLSEGRVEEAGSPKELLMDETSAFSSLVRHHEQSQIKSEA